MSQVLHQKAAEEGMVGGSAQRKSTSASLGKDDSEYSPTSGQRCQIYHL